MGGVRARMPLLYAALVVPALATACTVGAPSVRAATPTGFQDNAVVTGLTQPTSVRFAPDGRVFVAEKSGLIKVFDELADPTPTVFADLTTNVDNFWDRGLLGLALDPGFSSGRPYVYALYPTTRRSGAPRLSGRTAAPTRRERRRVAA